MTRLTAAELPIDEPSWRAAQRAEALETFRTKGLPDLADEVWHYAPLEHFSLEEVELATPTLDEGATTSIGGRTPAAVVTVSAGALVHVDVAASGLEVTTAPLEAELGTLVGAADAFASLDLALTPGPVVVDVAAGTTLDGPVVVLVDCPEGASFPRLLVRLGAGSRARVLEHVTGPSATVVAGVAEYLVGEGANLEVCTVQTLGDEVWSLARTRGRVERAATFSQVVVGLGAHYDRVRADVLLEGEGAVSVLHTAHVGAGTQVHDLRTMQVHVGRRTESRLRSKAAVSGSAGSIYSGLIAMRPGAKKADASQVNSSLVLSDTAHADAVPNLDIEENDVKCSHASSVGPVDAEQRWYLESRGISPSDAVQLILEGFFYETEQLLDDESLAAVLRESITRLDATAVLQSPQGAT